MADALRELLARFVVEVDPEGKLAKGNADVDRLKSALATLEDRLSGLRAPAQRAAKGISDVFARAAQDANKFLQLQQAQALGGRNSSDGFAAAGAAARERLPGVQFGPQRADLERFQNSFRGRMQALAQGSRRAFSGIASGANDALRSVTSLRLGVVGLIATAALWRGARFVGQLGDVGEAAQKLGVTNAEFQRLSVLAEQNSTSVETLGAAFRTLSRNAVDPSKDATAAFKALGVQTKSDSGAFKTRQQLFFETAGALAEVQDETRRAALAQQVFGRGAVELAPLLANGRAGLEAQRAALERLPVASDGAIKAADELSDRFAVLRAQGSARLSEGLEEVAPTLMRLLDLFSDLIEVSVRASKESGFFSDLKLLIGGTTTTTKLFNSALEQMGTTGESVFTRLLGWISKALLAFDTLLNFPALFAQDLQAFLSGRAQDSAIGGLIESLNLVFTSLGQSIQSTLTGVFNWIREQIGQLGAEAAVGLFSQIPGAAGALQLAGALAGPQTAGAVQQLAGAAPGAAPNTTVSDQRQQNVTVQVGTVQEVAGAVSQAVLGFDASPLVAALAAVGG